MRATTSLAWWVARDSPYWAARHFLRTADSVLMFGSMKISGVKWVANCLDTVLHVLLTQTEFDETRMHNTRSLLPYFDTALLGLTSEDEPRAAGWLATQPCRI